MGALDAIPPLVFDALLKGSVLIAVAAMLARLLRDSSATARNAVWTVALLGQLALPALSLALPSWNLPVLPRATSSVAAALAATTLRHTGGYASSSLAPNPLPTRHPAAATTLLSTGAILAILWLIGLIGVLARLWIGNRAVRRLVRQAEPVDDRQWFRLTREIATAMHIRRPITLLYGDHRAIPMTWGIVHPKVLLPHEAAEWPADRCRLVLLHEMAHVKRFDALTQLAAQLALAVLWMNPLVWVAARRMAAERERACDDHVLRDGAAASTYARELLEMVQTLGAERNPMVAALALGRRSDFESRMLAILDPRLSRRSLDRRGAVMTGLLAGLVIVSLAVLRPVARKDVASAKPSTMRLPPVAAQFPLRAAEPTTIKLLVDAQKSSEALASRSSRRPAAAASRRNLTLAATLCTRFTFGDWAMYYQFNFDTSSAVAGRQSASKAPAGEVCGRRTGSRALSEIASRTGNAWPAGDSIRVVANQVVIDGSASITIDDAAKELTVRVSAPRRGVFPKSYHDSVLVKLTEAVGQAAIAVRMLAVTDELRGVSVSLDSLAHMLGHMHRQGEGPASADRSSS